jgi:hypothetical protein
MRSARASFAADSSSSRRRTLIIASCSRRITKTDSACRGRRFPTISQTTAGGSSSPLFEKMRLDDFTRVEDDDPTRFDEEIYGKTIRLNYTGAGLSWEPAGWAMIPKPQWWTSSSPPTIIVVGSSTFPTGATANPTLKLAALSLQTAEHILDTDFRR